MVHDKGYVLGFMAGELLLTSSLEECVFIRPRELAAMQAAGMASVRDLLFMLPRRYEDRRMFDRYDSLSSGVPVCLRGRVVDVGWKGWADGAARAAAGMWKPCWRMSSLWGRPVFPACGSACRA